MFYWLVVFGIHRFSDGKVLTYMYDEVTVKEGSNEVASLLISILQLM
jgi:hypothetical protein